MDRVGVLTSGGLDSSVLLADMAQDAVVYPIYVQMGLAWEDVEWKALGEFIAALDNPNVQPVTSLRVPIGPFYGEHWSVTGEGVPGADTEDSAVFLPGRNIFLIGLTAVWCSTHGVSRIAIGSLEENPFPDATPEFFDSFGRVLSQGLAHEVEVTAPYRGLHKEELIRRHRHLPLELTLTCMAPQGGAHCGACNKCRERRMAFERAGVADSTEYMKNAG